MMKTVFKRNWPLIVAWVFFFNYYLPLPIGFYGLDCGEYGIFSSLLLCVLLGSICLRIVLPKGKLHTMSVAFFWIILIIGSAPMFLVTWGTLSAVKRLIEA